MLRQIQQPQFPAASLCCSEDQHPLRGSGEVLFTYPGTQTDEHNPTSGKKPQCYPPQGECWEHTQSLGSRLGCAGDQTPMDQLEISNFSPCCYGLGRLTNIVCFSHVKDSLLFLSATELLVIILIIPLSPNVRQRRY